MASGQVRLDVARSAMGEEAWATEYQRGQALSLDDAVRLALEYTEER